MALTKIFFKLDSEDWHGHSSESLWAEIISQSENSLICGLENSPFFYQGVSWMDIVRCVKNVHDGGWEFESFVEKSKNSTYMILSVRGDNRVKSYWSRLEALGCSAETGDVRTRDYNRLLSVNVPETTDLSEVWEIMEEGERADVWRFQEGARRQDRSNR